MLEIASFTPSSAIAASKAGAHRIELCSNYAAGGVTPSMATLAAARDALAHVHSDDDGVKGQEQRTHEAVLESRRPCRMQMYVMIRPRGGDFTYTSSEFEEMRGRIQMFRESGLVDGFVFGVLGPVYDNDDEREHEHDHKKRKGKTEIVDMERNKELVDLAAPLPCTFHRAIDQISDLDAAVTTIISCGFSSILTSGGAQTAAAGVEVVARLQRKYGEQISFILGGEIRRGNVVDLKRRAGVQWVHSAAITKEGEGEEVDGEEVRGLMALVRDG